MFKTKTKFNIAIVGATGIVGESILDILYSRKFPIEKIVPLASKKSAGTQIKFGDELIDVIALDDYDFKLLSIYLREKWGVYIIDQQIFFE